MSGYIELRAAGNARLFLRAGDIVAMVTPQNGRADLIATPDQPIRLVLPGGASIDVYGESAESIFLRCENAKQVAKQNEFGFWVDRLDRIVRDAPADPL